MKQSEGESIDEKIKKSLKTFEGIAEIFDGVIRPPPDLRPEKRAVFVCLGIGTIGILVLAYLRAEWYGFVAELVLVVATAILVRIKLE